MHYSQASWAVHKEEQPEYLSTSGRVYIRCLQINSGQTRNFFGPASPATGPDHEEEALFIQASQSASPASTTSGF